MKIAISGNILVLCDLVEWARDNRMPIMEIRNNRYIGGRILEQSAKEYKSAWDDGIFRSQTADFYKMDFIMRDADLTLAKIAFLDRLVFNAPTS